MYSVNIQVVWWWLGAYFVVHVYILMPTLLASDSFSRHLTLRLSVCVCVLCQWKNIVVAIKPKPACTTISIVFFSLPPPFTILTHYIRTCIIYIFKFAPHTLT